MTMKGAKKKADTMRFTVKKTVPKGKPAKDPNMPKRPASAFFVFMEGFRKQFKEENPTVTSVVAVGKAGGAKWKSMSESEKAPFVAEAEQRKTAGISSVQSVLYDDDLLTEILLKLPVLSLVLFKSVSKRWLSLIKDANVTFRRKLDPPSGLILKNCTYRHSYDFSYEFVPLDIRIPICRSYLRTTKESTVSILDSCNGLLLCSTFFRKLCVYNPTITNMFTFLPEPDNLTPFHNCSLAGGLKTAFDPTKSPHYKVIYGECIKNEWGRIHTYSSETGNWSRCGHQFPICYLHNFKDGVYWNDDFYWLNGRGKFFKLDIMNEHPVLTALQTPLTFDIMNGYSLFESRGCLLLVDEGNDDSQHITIYEKGNVYSEWSVKCIVNLDDIIKPFPERFMSKTLSTISDLGPNEDLMGCFQFIPSFSNV